MNYFYAKLGFQGATDLDIVDQCNNISTALAAHPKLKESPQTPIQITAEGQKILTALNAMKFGSGTAKEKDDVVDEVKKVIRGMAIFTDSVAGGEYKKITELGFLYKKSASKSNKKPALLETFDCTISKTSGCIDIKLKRPKGGKFFVFEVCDKSEEIEKWVEYHSTMETKLTLNGFVRGREYAIRAFAKNGNGNGPTSNTFVFIAN